MVRSARTCGVAFGIAVAIVSQSFLELLNPAFGQEVSKDAKAALKERDQLWDESQKLQAAGKLGEAIAAAEAMLAIERKVLTAGHEDLAVSLDVLAGMYLEHDDFAAAKRAGSEALEILRKLFGEAHWKATDARLALEDVGHLAGMPRDQRQKLAEAGRLNIEVAALDGAGKYDEALQSAQRAVAILKDVLGERRPLYAASLNNLAELLGSKGNYAAARPIHEQVLAIRKAVLGERHPDYAQSLNNLAALFHSQGDFAAARSLYEQALGINKEVQGERHPLYATSLNSLADLLESQGDYAAARPLFEKALAIRKEVLGERHPDYATSLNNLATLLGSQGDYAAARPRYETALAIYKDVLGERHPRYATSLNNLANLLESHGDYAAAKPLLEKALAIDKEVLGERHPDYALRLNNLAMLLRAQGDYAASRSLIERASEINKDVLGERHPLYATSLNNLANVLESQGDYAAAGPLYEKALAIRKEVLGVRHPGYATSLSNLGFLLWAQRDHAGAATFLNLALEIAQGNLELAAAAQSERQQLAMAQEFRADLHAYLSLAPMAKLSPRDAYRHVLASKGAILQRQRLLRVLRRRFQTEPRSQAAQRFADYEQVVKQLATLALARPDPKQAQAAREKLADLARSKDELEAELTRLDAGLMANEAKSSQTPEQLQAALPPGSALVDLLVYTAYQPPAQGKGEFQRERRLAAFVVCPDRPIARIDLGPIAPILKAIDEWRPFLIGRQAAPAANNPAKILRRLIWNPVEPHIAGIKKVLVSPDGALGQVPLAALPGKELNRYVIEERSISVVPVPRTLGANATRTPKGDSASSLLLAGDINYGGEAGLGGELAMKRSAAAPARADLLADFKALAETRIEILAVRDSFEERFPDSRAQVLRGDKATEEAIRQTAPKSRYLHLATHGYFAPPELRSALGPGERKAARTGVDLLGGSSVAGYHPGLLSGIALAGANVRPTPIGHDAAF
jgi:tetratricopeptide (TPR) repeat protein